MFQFFSILALNPPPTINYQTKWANERAAIVYEITKEAKQYNINIETALKIAEAESNLNPRAINHNTNGTTDKGIFQINDIHNVPDSCRLDYKCNIHWAIQEMATNGTTVWYSSNHNWK